MTGHRSALASAARDGCRWLQRVLTPFGAEVRQRWPLHVLIALVLAASYQHLLFNLTPSLPYVLAVLERGATVQRGAMIVFRFDGGEIGPYLKGQWFFKRVAGVPGDMVRVRPEWFVNATPVGFAKPRSHAGEPLEPIAPGPIPPGHYYVQGTHPDSFDSRYRVNGLIRAEQILGVAHPVF
jgi:conjugal transfer pilin signal peptidase TrbI